MDSLNIENDLSISSLTILAGCGNLYLHRSKFSHFVEHDDVKTCVGVDDLLIDENKILIRQADKVIFASSWTDWEADFFQESYRNLIADYGDKFWFFGNKHLDFSPSKFIRINGNTGFPSSVSLSADKAKINAKLRDIVGEKFIDPYQLFCVDKVYTLLSDSGDLLLYDGFHLSREGTNYFSSKLKDVIRLLKNKQ